MGKLFGTDGGRGVANKEVTGRLALKIGRAAGYYLKNFNSEENPVILVGKDTRLSGDMLESALIGGITSTGVHVYRLGVIPTPGLAYLTGKKKAVGGIMISASHNPIEDNGLKIFDSRGYKLSDDQEEKLEELIFNEQDTLSNLGPLEIGSKQSRENLREEYINFLANIPRTDFSHFKVVLDCAHGAPYYTAPRVLKKLGVKTVVINGEPDGRKINVDCGSTAPEKIKDVVLDHEADLGIAHDGDGDRVLLVDHKGQIVDGDKIMAVLALDMIDRDSLKDNVLVTTRYSNLGLREVIEENEGSVKIVKNGDKYVLKEMLNNDYNLGGEKSGHVISLDYNTTGDGLLTALRVMKVMDQRDQKLHQLAGCMKEWPQERANVKVEEKEGWSDNEKIQNMISQAQKELGDEARVFIRASGTEPVIRILLEGREPEKLSFWEEKLSAVIQEELG